MRKILAVLLALAALLCVPAFAEAQWVEYDFGDFTMSFPEDIMCSISGEIVNNEPFFVFYQDYDETAAFNKSLNGVWSEGAADLTTVDPTAYGQTVLATVASQLGEYGIAVTDPALIAAALDAHDGKPALSIIYGMGVDYSAVGVDLQMTLYTMQAVVSDEALGGSYTFTISTDDITAATLLMEIMDTIQWTV